MIYDLTNIMKQNSRIKLDIDNLPVVALVGRVNVGKSTLFNKLIEENKAVISNIPGTTRTSNEGLVLWRGKYFRLIDTGGLTFTDEVPLEEDILKQSERAMKEAGLVLFITDAQTGILPQEKELAKRLRRIAVKSVILIGNKVDKKKDEINLTEPEWAKLGLGEPFPISAASGRNTGDLLDVIFKELNKTKRRPKTKKTADEKNINIAIIGRPNAGKSSLFNKLVGQEKVIVSDLPHTTREPHDTVVIYEKQPINFIDTAGIRRKAKVAGQLERAGIKKSLAAVEESDIVLFVLDGSETMSHQDKQLGGLLEKRGKSVIILLNKWDLAEDNSDSQRQLVKEMVYAHFPHLDFAPIEFTSGLTGYGVHKIFPTILKVWQGRQTEVGVKALEHFLKQTTKQHRPARGKGTRHPKLMGIRQIDTCPPVFEIFIKYRTSLHRSYVNFIENKLREQFDFTGTPVIIKLTKLKK